MNRLMSRSGLVIASLAVVVFSLFPVFVMLSTAVDEDANAGGRGIIPGGLTLEHFARVLTETRFPDYLMNKLPAAARAPWDLHGVSFPGRPLRAGSLDASTARRQGQR